ncbi:Pol polyprotein [Sesamum angolense]|uniref:Pol polyprotein n=1 Tax=Sesamum angolense TaxID=2727404 RepID=A0AAE1W0M4_9LAMI|nr:Pol polyprotein [Sesamum angolense]
MMEVVKKEILKLLNAGMIFAISDSEWVFIKTHSSRRSRKDNIHMSFWHVRLPTNALWGIEVDQAKIDVIKSLPYPASVREIRSFLGHAGYYRRFIKDFSKIAQLLCNLLQKDKVFGFDEACKQAFSKLKESLTSTPIIRPPNWKLSFEIMCNARNHDVGAVLGQRIGRDPHVIYYVSRMLDSTKAITPPQKKNSWLLFLHWKNFVPTCWELK